MRNPLEPIYCPICGSKDISTKYTNDGNGSYTEWYEIECRGCDASGTISVNQEFPVLPIMITVKELFPFTQLKFSLIDPIEIEQGKSSIKQIVAKMSDHDRARWFHFSKSKGEIVQ